jgi:hypothetical protein
VCAEASTVLRAVAADFYFNCWYSEIPSDNRIRHKPRCVHCDAQGFRLETLQRSDISMVNHCVYVVSMVLTAMDMVWQEHLPGKKKREHFKIKTVSIICVPRNNCRDF